MKTTSVTSLEWRKRVSQISCQLFLVVVLASISVGVFSGFSGQIMKATISFVVATSAALAFRYAFKQIDVISSDILTLTRNIEIERHKTFGLFQRGPEDKVVAATLWGKASTSDEWVFGESRLLLPDDLVIVYNHGGWCGLAIERGGKIVASRRTIHFDYFPER